MKRKHLFEFEDQSWFPSSIRNGMTDYLRFVANHFDFYRSIVPVLKKGLDKSGGTTIVDLAAGGGGGWARLSDHLSEAVPNLRVVLTDRYPNPDAFEQLLRLHPAMFSVREESVDARQVPEDLVGLRTQFLSFHHFRPKDAQRILQNAVDARQPIAVFEAQKRDLAHFVKFAMSPLAVLLMTPAIRPFRWSRLLLTYAIPAIPLFTFWDGLVSVLRTYSAEELRAMTAQVRGGDAFTWEIGECHSGPVTVPYLLGYPA